jgi:hypothetical protein
MSTALMTHAQRVTIQAYDATSTLVGSPLTLQVTSSQPKKEMNSIDLTNTESFGFAEWAPSTVIGHFAIEGVVDIDGASDIIWLTMMDNKVFAQMVLYMTKPIGGLAATAIRYTANVLFQNFTMTNKTQANGEISRFSAEGRVIGRFVRSGTSFSGAQISGFVQN